MPIIFHTHIESMQTLTYSLLWILDDIYWSNPAKVGAGTGVGINSVDTQINLL